MLSLPHRIIVSVLFLCSTTVSFAQENAFRLAYIEGLSRPPYYWVNPCTGKSDGVSSTILKTIFKRLNISLTGKTYQISHSLRDQIGDDIVDNKIDGAFLSLNDNDNDFLMVKTPFLSSRTGILTLTGHPFHYTSLKQLKTKNGAILGSINLQMALEKISSLHADNLRLEPLLNVEEGLQKLINGEYDYILGTVYGLSAIPTVLHGIGQFKVSALEENLSAPIYLAIGKKSIYRSYLPIIDKELNEIKDSGLEKHIYRSSMKNWLNQQQCVRSRTRKKAMLQAG